MHGDVEKLLRDLIRAHRGPEAEHVGLDARFIEDLGFDSLNVLGLIDSLEERLHIHYPPTAGGKPRDEALPRRGHSACLTTRPSGVRSTSPRPWITSVGRLSACLQGC